jgi:maltose alpha-D-glucosyltransferase/alpha-amylase
MRNMIALRKLFQVFGRGRFEFLSPANRKILACFRRIEGEQILCVMNLSRFAQPVDLDLASLAGMTPVEMLGYVEFPPITRQPYRLIPDPYGFLGLELYGTPEPMEQPADVVEVEMKTKVADGWAGLIPNLQKTVLPEFLQKQRWFGGKSRKIQRVRVTDWAESGRAAMMLLEVTYESGPPDRYFAPFIMADGVLQDAIQDDEFCAGLLTLTDLVTRQGRIKGEMAEEAKGASSLPIRRGSAEQSNSSIIYGDKLIFKLFRRQQAGPNPEIEIGKFLTEKAHFERVPRFMGAMEYTTESEEPSALAIVQGLVANEGDGWKWTIEELERYYETTARKPIPQEMGSAGEHVGAYLEAATALGRRTGELHLALAGDTSDPEFSPKSFEPREIDAFTQQLRDEAERAFDLLRGGLAPLPDELMELAGMALGRRRHLIDRLNLPTGDRDYGKRIRTHGDYHLGQVLRTKNDFVILDFEGEPARSLRYRRAKYSPLRDVAGMLRSFSYAATATLMAYTTRHPEDFDSLQPWARFWEQNVSAEFLSAYRQVVKDANIVPGGEEEFGRLLDTCLFEKAMYELMYELNNRPTWVRIPLTGILALGNVKTHGGVWG